MCKDTKRSKQGQSAREAQKPIEVVALGNGLAVVALEPADALGIIAELLTHSAGDPAL